RRDQAFGSRERGPARDAEDRSRRDSRQARLALDVRLLHHREQVLREKSDDRAIRSDAGELAKRIAPQFPGNRLVWEVLLETQVLEDGMTVEQAEKVLGPATDTTPERIGWYF
ncbi:hypothetical protein HK102_009410, partial [Quaeritorhiza haematococci]